MRAGRPAVDLGDANRDGDTDWAGTGERAATGRDSIFESGRDIVSDHITSIEEIQAEDDEWKNE